MSSAEKIRKMDTNKDGSVTAAEMDASHKRMMKDHSRMDHKKPDAKPKSSGD